MLLHGVWCLYLSAIGAISLADSLDKMGFMRMSFRIDGQIVQATPLLAVQVKHLLMKVFIYDINNIFLFNSYVFYHGSNIDNFC